LEASLIRRAETVIEVEVEEITAVKSHVLFLLTDVAAISLDAWELEVNRLNLCLEKTIRGICDCSVVVISEITVADTIFKISIRDTLFAVSRFAAQAASRAGS
jgi:hypothetical protein